MAARLDEIECHVPALRRYARALTHDADLADDLVQDCLERAIRKRELWRPTGSLRGWLFRILLNVYRNDLRTRRRVQAVVVPDTGLVEPAATAPEHGRLALAETARAMQALAPEQREALLLVAVEGMSYAEAAAVLRIPPGTLMSRLARGRAALRQAIEDGPPKLRTVR
ncbi:MAG TPA: sigma-70 family RNA polymerase sigma factor [Amaricoccus sp.]|nr:sigma-70 family RNA polymerase sigma factor [Amaricoccus sp.]